MQSVTAQGLQAPSAPRSQTAVATEAGRGQCTLRFRARGALLQHPGKKTRRHRPQLLGTCQKWSVARSRCSTYVQKPKG